MPKKRFNILVAEDEPLVLMSLAEMIADMGHCAFEVSDGKEALNFLAVHPETDFLITDINMPRLDGLHLVEGARKLMPHLKVIYSSGYQSLKANGLKKDSHSLFLCKPYGSETLKAAIQTLNNAVYP